MGIPACCVDVATRWRRRLPSWPQRAAVPTQAQGAAGSPSADVPCGSTGRPLPWRPVRTWRGQRSGLARLLKRGRHSALWCPHPLGLSGLLTTGGWKDSKGPCRVRLPGSGRWAQHQESCVHVARRLCRSAALVFLNHCSLAPKEMTAGVSWHPRAVRFLYPQAGHLCPVTSPRRCRPLPSQPLVSRLTVCSAMSSSFSPEG